MALDYGTIKERMDLQGIYHNNDKTLFKVESTYYRAIDGGKRPLRKYESRVRYLILKPYQMTLRDVQQIEATTPTLKVIIPVETIHVPSDATVVPDDFWAPSALESQLPISPGGASNTQFKMDEPIPFKYKEKVIYLRYNDVKIQSNRDMTKWWALPAFYTAIVVELPIQFAASVLAIPIAAADVLFVELPGRFIGRSRIQPSPIYPKRKIEQPSKDTKKNGTPP